jgi:non-specific serine/threonine protein kinase
MWIVCNLGRVATEQGDLVAAHASFLDGLVIARDNLGGRGRLSMPLEGLAQLAAASGRPVQAFRLAGAAAILRETYAIPAAPSERVQLERWLSRARTRIGARAADAAWRAGCRLRAEEAIAEALAIEIDLSQPNVVSVNQPRLSDGLTTREREIAMLIAGGLATRQIADRLVIAEGTVRVHVERILSKLGLHSRTQLAAWAVHQGYVPVLTS